MNMYLSPFAQNILLAEVAYRAHQHNPQCRCVVVPTFDDLSPQAVADMLRPCPFPRPRLPMLTRYRMTYEGTYHTEGVRIYRRRKAGTK
jgi:hypothetical protein